MVIYLKHELHGTKVACSEAEAKADESKGWKRYEIAALLRPHVEAPAPVQPEDTDELTKLRGVYQERFGKRAHHKKTVDTLRRELEA